MKYKILTILFTLAGMTAFSQERAMVGKVVDHKGKPVVGALVSVSGTSVLKTTTAKDGSFKLEVDPGCTLVVAADGTGEKYVTATSDSINIQLDWKDESITLGNGITQRREEMTGAISTVKSEELMKSSAFKLSNTLFGNALGLTALQNAGSDWENGASFYIRGIKTLSDNGILILVDGIERSIDELVPDEVESVQVMRDAAALALYGYRGINGALLVNTKRGKYKNRGIEVRYDHGFVKPFRLPEFVNAYTYASAVNEAREQDGLSTRYSEYELEAWKNGDYPNFYADVDWVDELFRDQASTNTYAVNMSGGGMNARYFTMLQLEDSRGLFDNTEANTGYSTQLKYSKANIRANVDVNISSTTSAQFNLLGVLSEHNRPGTNHGNIINYLYEVPSSAFPIRSLSGAWSGSDTYTTKNPLANLQGSGYARQHSRSLFADMKLIQKLDAITKGLSAAIRFSYDNTAIYWESTTKTFEWENDLISFDANGVPSTYTTNSGSTESSLSFSKSLGSQSRRYYFGANVDWERTFGKHSIYATAILSYDHPTTNSQHRTYYRDNFSVYAHYGYDNRYYLDFSVTSSGSNRLTEQHRWAASPVVSGAWVISNESFMKEQSLFDYLKLRASWGVLNTDYVPEVNMGVQTYDSGSGYNMKENTWYSGMKEGRLVTRDPRNERAYKSNIGLDAQLFDKLTLTVDGYYERRDHIFVTTSGNTSSVLGATNPYVIAGRVDSHGIEIGANYMDHKGDFSWNVGAQFTFNRNEIKEDYGTKSPYGYNMTKGHRVGQLFGLESIGYFSSDAEIASSPEQQFSAVSVGDIKYKDENEDNFINTYDFKPIGYSSSCPEIYYSFNLGADWKGFGFSANFQGVEHYSANVYATGMEYALVGDVNLSQDRYDNRWTPATPNAKYPRLTTLANANNSRTSTTWLKNLSYLKLRNCEVYYNFPQHILSKAKMTSAKLYVRGMNVWQTDKMDELYDPEAVGVTMPATTSWHVGLSIGF